MYDHCAKAYCLFFFEIHYAISRSRHDVISKWKALAAVVVLEAHLLSLTMLWAVVLFAQARMPSSGSLLIPVGAVLITAVNYWIFFESTETTRGWEREFRLTASRKHSRRSARITGAVVICILLYAAVSYIFLPSQTPA